MKYALEFFSTVEDYKFTKYDYLNVKKNKKNAYKQRIIQRWLSIT
jgi:hypothetical protein